MSDFQIYRALQKIHLGGLEPAQHIEEGERISFNGSTIKRESGDQINLQFPSALKAAINYGWLVPNESTETSFTQKSAGVEVRTAVSTKDKRERVPVMTVQDEERDLGTLTKVRPSHAPPLHQASDSGKLSKTASTGAMVIKEEAEFEGEGRIIKRLRNPSHAAPVEIGKDDRKILASMVEPDPDRMPTTAPRAVATGDVQEARAVATGDVQEARSGDELSDLLPDAVSSGKPAPGPFKDEGVKVANTGSSVGGQEDGTVVGRVPSAKTPPDPEAALKEWATTGSVGGQVLSLKEVSGLVKLVFRKMDGLKSELSALKEDMKSLQSSPAVESVSAPSPVQSFPDHVAEIVSKWDLSPHWKSRAVKVISLYGDQPQILRAIEAIEADGVKKAIHKRLVTIEPSI